ncbi:hypothetical protein EGW08_012436 [Elysia chlorotica]|uniref:Uncharacterized protein n=1 Tax=Elysia chlorotica TaxID=188477 RepID=A0A433TDX2_ELYCH|nr:hypothetical protein EGW08_012436 [Elysia chlorotica]
MTSGQARRTPRDGHVIIGQAGPSRSTTRTRVARCTGPKIPSNTSAAKTCRGHLRQNKAKNVPCCTAVNLGLPSFLVMLFYHAKSWPAVSPSDPRPLVISCPSRSQFVFLSPTPGLGSGKNKLTTMGRLLSGEVEPEERSRVKHRGQSPELEVTTASGQRRSAEVKPVSHNKPGQPLVKCWTQRREGDRPTRLDIGYSLTIVNKKDLSPIKPYTDCWFMADGRDGSAGLILRHPSDMLEARVQVSCPESVTYRPTGALEGLHWDSP